MLTTTATTARRAAATARAQRAPAIKVQNPPPIVLAQNAHPVYGTTPIGRGDFALENQSIHMLNFWHKKAIAASEAYWKQAPKNKPDDDPEYETLYSCKWAIFEAALKAKINNAREFAILLELVQRHASDAGGLSDVLNLDQFKGMTQSLAVVTEPLRPMKRVGALQRGRKLTRAGLLHRYQCFLIQELETLSWNLYGSRDYALQYRFVDRAVDQRCSGSYGKGSKRRSYPFFDESKLSARARGVLKSLRIDTERNDDVPVRKSSKRGSR